MKSKQSFWKKLAAFLALGLGVLTMSACQTTNYADAQIYVKESQVSIYTKEETGKRYATISLAVANNTIYNVIDWDINFTVYYTAESGKAPFPTSNVVKMGILHGQAGVVVFAVDEVPNDVTAYKITSASAKTFQNIWDSYIGWWIAAIIIVAFSLIFYGIEIFSRGITASDAIDMYKKNIASSICVFLFALIICIFPVFFGAWVPTVILTIALATSILGAGLFTGIKSLASK